MLAAMRYHVWLATLALLSTAACDKKSDTQPTDPTPAPSATPTVEEPKPKAVADIDVKHIQEQLKCPAKGHKAACDVLEGFETGKKWDLTTIQSQEARYFGKAIGYKDGVPEERWVFLLVKKVPLNEVTPGDLPLRVALRDLDKSRVAENQHAEKLLWLLQRDDSISKRNTTANFILTYTSNNWDSAAPTDGASTILHIAGGTYVREGKGRSLHVINIEAARPGSTSIDGTMVQLYPISW